MIGLSQNCGRFFRENCIGQESNVLAPLSSSYHDCKPKRAWSSRHRVVLAILVAGLALVFISGDRVAAQEKSAAADRTVNEEFHRQIFVPFESLDVLLEGNSNRVLLTRGEYDALLKSAQTRDIERAPLDSAIVSAKYSGQVSDGVAQIQGELIVEALNEGLIQIPLPFSGVAIRSAQLGDRPARLWRNQAGEIVLLTSGEFRETLKLELTLPMETSAARQTMSLQVPTTSATEFDLTVPGNVEVKSGVPVAQRTYDAESDTTRFELLASRRMMTIVMSLNNRLLKDEQVVVSRSVLIHKLAPSFQEIHLTCSLDVIHGALDEVQFNVPRGFQISQVTTELLSQWEVQQDSEQDDQRLIVRFRQPTREDVVLNITATRNQSTNGSWTGENIRPLGVAGSVCVVGILADDQLEVSKLQSEGLIPIDYEFLLAAIPGSVHGSNTSSPVKVVAAFYAPQKDYLLSAQFRVPKPELIVRSNSRLLITNRQLELQGGLSLSNRYDSSFAFKLVLPRSWRLNRVTDINNQVLKFDRLNREENSAFVVSLPGRIGADSPTRIFFEATSTPENWLDQWESNTIEFPVVTIEGQTRHTGAIAVATEEDIDIKPGDLQNLDLLDENDKKMFELDRRSAPLAFQFKDSDYQLALDLNRRLPTLIARTYNFFKVQPNQLGVHVEMVVEVKQAKADEFQFELPLDSPKSIRIRSRNDPLKDYFSEDSDNSRIWTVLFSKPRMGNVHLLVDYQVPMEESELVELKLSSMKVRDVSFQSSLVAVEGSTELDIEIQTAAREVDIGELAEAVRQPGRFTLGAYSWPNENLDLTIKATRRPVYRLPAAIVQRAEMVTAISTSGKSQTAARFKLATKQQPFLRIELPVGATLWSVRLDGQPAKPQLQNGALLVSLIGSETGKLRDLQLVFESEVSKFNLVGTVETFAPKLFLNETAAEQGDPVPLVDLQWRLMMPDGFSVSHGDGDFQSDQLLHRPTPIQQLGGWIYRLGGGIGEIAVLPTMQQTVFTSERVAARAPGGDDLDAAESWRELGEKSKKLDLGREQPAPPAKPESDFKFGEGLQQAGPMRGQALADDSRKASLWALSGLRSLNIELTEWGNSIQFYNLGEQPVLKATVVNQTRLNWVAIAFAFFIASLGVLLSRRKLKTKVFFVLVVLLAAGLVPLAGASLDALATVLDLVVLAVVFVAIYFVLASLIRLLGRSLSRAAAHLPMLSMFLAVFVLAGPSSAQQIIQDASELKRLIQELQTETAVTLPDDAIIIPFDPEDPEGRRNAERLLLPYEHYLELIKKAVPEQDPQTLESPVGYVLSSAQYETRLSLEDDISIVGRLVIDVLTDKPVSVALPLLGGALSDAKVDGQPAKLQFGSPNNRSENNRSENNRSENNRSPNQRSVPKAKGESVANIIQLHLEGRGSKVFEFNVRLKPVRQGGWRSIRVRLPVGLTRGLKLISLPAPTDIRLNADADRRSIEAQPGQPIETVLNADGSFRMQWRPATDVQAVDQSLTARSEAIFDVREDGLRLTWHVELEFRGSERDVFTLNLPAGFLVEQVNGENIRAWDVKQNRGTENNSEPVPDQLTISLLGIAKDRESFTVELSQREYSVNDATVELDAPYLTVEGAALHQGVYEIRRSPIIDLKTTQQRAVSRIDKDPLERRVDRNKLDAKSSPLGVKSFQVLQFVATPFRIGLAANLVPRKITASTQTVLRIGQSEADMEMKINLSVGRRPIFNLSIDLPKDAEIRRLSAGLKESWTTESLENVQRVHFTFPSGIVDDFSIILEAALTEFEGGEQWAIPQVRINDVQQQTGQIAVQVDPSLNVTTADMQDCEMLLLQQIERWLNKDQRSNSRLALRTRGSDYFATLRFARIQPRVTVETITNVRTTRFAIEETILLDFDIQQAGIRQIQFELPVELRNARIAARLVSETTIEDVVDNPEAVRVTLDLQDEVIDSYRVVIENDRQLNDAQQRVPIPRVLTGVTEQQYATLQNVGRDEITTLPSPDFQTLNRQLSAFTRLKQKLAGFELTMAFVAKPETDWPVLHFENRQREVFETVAASIEFSKTTMVVDASGAYRALQNFQINNRSEQYLDIQLPEGARLLTVVVENRPVKPVAWPAAGDDRRLRVPLVKTPPGDLDYPVQLKYAGQLGDLSNFNEIEFPVIQTLNINVQLSQLHLRLPESHRWLNFGGTMTKVDSRGDLEQSFLSYKARQIQQLAEQIQSKSATLGSSYSKSRAFKNLKRLEQDMADYASANPKLNGQAGKQLLNLLEGNNEAIHRAQQVYSVDNQAAGEIQTDNRERFNSLLEEQSARIARNSVTRGRGGQNFYFRELASQQPMPRSGSLQNGLGEMERKDEFDARWLNRNKLNSKELTNQPAQGQLGMGMQQPTISSIVPEVAQMEDESVTYFNPNNLPSRRTKGALSQSESGDKMQIQSGVQANGDDDLFGARGMGGRVLSGGELNSPDENRYSERGRPNGQISAGPGKQGGQLGQTPVEGEDLAGAEFEDFDNAQSAADEPFDDGKLSAALTSLDIELPVRGADYYFKAPRGKASVTARTIEASSVSRWSSAIITVVVCVFLWIGCLVFLSLARRRAMRFVGAVTLVVAGVVSVITGFLPIYGLIAVATGCALFVDWLTRTVWSQDQVPEAL